MILFKRVVHQFSAVLLPIESALDALRILRIRIRMTNRLLKLIDDIAAAVPKAKVAGALGIIRETVYQYLKGN